MPKMYFVVRNGCTISSRRKGLYAGYSRRKIFGRLDCASGLRKMKPENRVFFLSWQDAIDSGYRPCKVCKPEPEPPARKKKKTSRRARR